MCMVQMFYTVAAAAKSIQSCPTLCDPIDGSPPGSAVPGILQARTLEWVAIAFSNEWKWKVKVKPLSRARLFVTPGTVAHRLLRPWDFPGMSTGVGYHCLSGSILRTVHIIFEAFQGMSWQSAQLKPCMFLLNFKLKFKECFCNFSQNPGLYTFIFNEHTRIVILALPSIIF